MSQPFRAPLAICLPLLLAACGEGADPLATESSLPRDGAQTVACDAAFAGGSAREVIVRRGRSCTLSAVAVRGNVKVEEGATLILLGGSVRGNVDAKGAAVVEVRGTSVDGNVQVQEGRSALVTDATVGGNIQIQKVDGRDDGRIVVNGNFVPKGNIQVEDNRVLALDVTGNVVGEGNVQVTKNRGDGPKAVADNRVGQNLQCKENSAPFLAAGNTAGDREGQCS